MADHPMIFSAPMVRALIEGRKTQTRRIVTPNGGGLWTGFGYPRSLDDTPIKCRPGDRLWVREHWKTDRHYDDLSPSEMGGDEPLVYLADSAVQRWGWKPDALSRWGRHRQAMHMPRWASRLTLTVTDVRVQRLQEISAEDATAEGVPFEADALAPAEWSVSRFADLWNSLHGAGAWDSNPWVAAYTFEVDARNIDQ